MKNKATFLPEAGAYLPDFRLILSTGESVYCEVNHSDADDFESSEIDKLREFATVSGCRTLLLTGVPDHRAYNQLMPNSAANSFTAGFFRDYAPFVCTADEYWFQALRLDTTTGRLHFDLDARALRKAFGRGYLEAVDLARGARFEHGESPK